MNTTDGQQQKYRVARTLEQIMGELNPYYATDRNLLQTSLDALPGQSEAEIKGLDAKLTQANDNILQSARGRGLGFSGIPIQEQAQYAATDYAPAVARVKQGQVERQTGILGSLNNLARDQRTQAQSIYDTERNFFEQQRQFNEQMKAQREAASAAARASSAGASGGDYLSSLLNGAGGGGPAPAPAGGGTQAQMIPRKGGGFNFNIGGKAVSAAAYFAATKGKPGGFNNIRDLLGYMAKAGDTGAKAALGFVGGDMKFDPRKMNAKNAALYNALFWGVGPTAKAPAPKPKAAGNLNTLRNAYKPGGWS